MVEGEGVTSTRLLSKSCRVCSCGINFCMIFEKASNIEWSNIEVIWYSIGTSSNPTSASSSPILCWMSLFMSTVNIPFKRTLSVSWWYLAGSRLSDRRLCGWRLRGGLMGLQLTPALWWNVIYSMLRGIRPVHINPKNAGIRGRCGGRYLSVDNKYQCTHFPKNRVKIKSRIKKVDLSRKIPYLEVDKRTISAFLP